MSERHIYKRVDKFAQILGANMNFLLGILLLR